MATKAALAKKTLQKLKVLGAGQNPENEDSTLVQDRYDELYAEYAERGFVTWGSSDSIPDEFVAPLATILSAEMADTFDVPEQRAARLQFEAYGPDQGERESAFSRLRRMSKPNYTSFQTKFLDY